MVVEGLITNMLASVLMNGLCCVHSMQEEEARRKEHQDFMRKSIHVEWERQRIMEREVLEKQLMDQGLTDAAVVAEARRRLLIATKIQARQESLSAKSLQHSRSSRFDVDTRSTRLLPDRQVYNNRPLTAGSRILTPPSSAMNMNSRIRSAPVWCVRDPELSGSVSVVSSLLDEEDDEDMEDVALQ